MAFLAIFPCLHVLSITCALVLFSYAYQYCQLYSKHRKLAAFYGCQPPPTYPHRFPILGLDAILDSIYAAKSHKYLNHQRAQYEHYGTTFSSRFYTSAVINTIEPENIRTVLSTKFEHYGIGPRRKNAFAPLLGREHSVFQLDGRRWRHSRNLLKPCFTHNKIASLGLFETHFQTFLKSLPTDGNATVDLAPLFLRCTANITMHFMFGGSISCLTATSTLDGTFLDAMHSAQRGCEERWQLGNLAGLFPMRAYWANIAVVNSYMDSKIVQAQEVCNTSKSVSAMEVNTSKSSGILGSLLNLSSSKVFLNEQLLTLFMAGSDTSAAHLTSLLHALSFHPRIWQMLRTEVASLNLGTDFDAGKSVPPTLAQLRSLKYVHQCINECHRLYPVLPSNSRVAYQDTVLPTGGGPDGKAPVFVAKGTMVAFSITALHRRKDIWGEDASLFRPERWAELGFEGAKEKSADNWNFIPFNGGPRACIGQELATIEIAYLLVRLVQHFEQVNRGDEEDWIEGLAMACTSRNGAKVILVPG